jgi:hypothetical protein
MAADANARRRPQVSEPHEREGGPLTMEERKQTIEARTFDTYAEALDAAEKAEDDTGLRFEVVSGPWRLKLDTASDQGGNDNG